MISVIMPAYNAEKTLRETVRSLMAQENAEFELIVVNDGSTDSTEAILNELSSKDNRVRSFHIRNEGVSNARNFGIAKAKGEYLMFLDADDKVCPDFISKMVEYMDQDTDLVVCGYRTMDEDGCQLSTFALKEAAWTPKEYYQGIEFLQDKLAFNTLWNKIFRKDIIQKNNIVMDKSVSMGEDMMFVIEYISFMTRKLRSIEDVLYWYRLSSDGLQATFDPNRSLERIDRTKYIQFLYEKKGYPVYGVLREQLRTMYVAVVEFPNTTKIVEGIRQSEAYRNCLQNYCSQGLKFDLFFFLLRNNYTLLLKFSTKLLKKIQQQRKKTCSW